MKQKPRRSTNRFRPSRCPLSIASLLLGVGLLALAPSVHADLDPMGDLHNEVAYCYSQTSQTVWYWADQVSRAVHDVKCQTQPRCDWNAAGFSAWAACSTPVPIVGVGVGCGAVASPLSVGCSVAGIPLGCSAYWSPVAAGCGFAGLGTWFGINHYGCTFRLVVANSQVWC